MNFAINAPLSRAIVTGVLTLKNIPETKCRRRDPAAFFMENMSGRAEGGGALQLPSLLPFAVGENKVQSIIVTSRYILYVTQLSSRNLYKNWLTTP